MAKVRSRIAGALLFLLSGVLAGCGSGKTQPTTGDAGPIPAVASELKDLGAMYQEAAIILKRPPTGMGDFKRFEEGYPIALKALRTGQIVVRYGTPVGDANAVLAHEKSAPEAGGWVLMANGQTVKRMTAEEIKAAPKPGS